MQLAWNCNPAYPFAYPKKVIHIDMKKKQKKKKKEPLEVYSCITFNVNVNGSPHTARKKTNCF